MHLPIAIKLTHEKIIKNRSIYPKKIKIRPKKTTLYNNFRTPKRNPSVTLKRKFVSLPDRPITSRWRRWRRAPTRSCPGMGRLSRPRRGWPTTSACRSYRSPGHHHPTTTTNRSTNIFKVVMMEDVHGGGRSVRGARTFREFRIGEWMVGVWCAGPAFGGPFLYRSSLGNEMVEFCIFTCG